MKRIVAVVIPVYKPTLSILETISLKQIKRILGKHPIFLAAPESLDTSYDGLGQDLQVERWPDEFFSSLSGYNQLMLSHGFYTRFHDFEYIFICQLDGFVFSDSLAEFCRMGYDYIGAPIPVSRWLGMPNHVGNGGVSLRKTQSMLRLLSEHKDIHLPNDFINRSYYGAEDACISYWMHNNGQSYSLPSIDVAAGFSLDQNIQHRFAYLNEKTLPFACHAWFKENFAVWRPFIEARGYDLSDVEVPNHYISQRMRTGLDFFIRRLSAGGGQPPLIQEQFFCEV